MKASLIANSGMSIKRSSGPKKADFVVEQGARAGSVRLAVRHPGGGEQYEADGASSFDGPRTVKAGVTLDDRTPGTSQREGLLARVACPWTPRTPFRALPTAPGASVRGSRAASPTRRAW
jgi:hypothetical protein